MCGCSIRLYLSELALLYKIYAFCGNVHIICMCNKQRIGYTNIVISFIFASLLVYQFKDLQSNHKDKWQQMFVVLFKSCIFFFEVSKYLNFSVSYFFCFCINVDIVELCKILEASMVMATDTCFFSFDHRSLCSHGFLRRK